MNPATKEIKFQVRSKSKIIEPLVWETPTGEKQVSFKKIRWDPDKKGFAALFSLSSLSPLVPGYYILRSKEGDIFKLIFEGVKIGIQKTDELAIEDTLTFKIFSPKLKEVDLELKDAELLTIEDNFKLGVRKVKCLITGFNPYIVARLPLFLDEVSLSAKPKVDLHKNQVDAGEQVRMEIVAPLDAEIKARWKSAVGSREIPLEELQIGKRSRRLKTSFTLEKAGLYEVEAVDQERGIFVSKKLTVRPKLISVSTVDAHYFIGQTIKLKVETSEPVEGRSFGLSVTDDKYQKSVKTDCLKVAERIYSLSFCTSKLGEGKHNLLLSVTKFGITSNPFQFQLDVIKGKIKVLPEERGWFQLGESIQLEVLATEASKATLVNLDTKEKQIIELQKSDQPFTFTGKAVPKDFGRFTVEVARLRSRKFAVGPELSVRCYKLEKNYWKLTANPSRYSLIIKVDGRVHPSKVRVSFSGRKKEEISLRSIRAFAKKETLTTYKLPLNNVISDVDSLKAGKYFVQVTAPYNSRKLHVHIPPPLEVEELGDTVQFVNERLTLKGRTEKRATLRVELKPVPSLALSLLPAQTTSIQSKAGQDGSFQVKLDLANLYPGLQYEVRVAAESGGVWTENLEAGRISLVKISRYCTACTKADEAIVIARVPGNVKVAIDGIEQPSTTPLPIRILRIVEPGSQTLSFDNRKVTISIEEEDKSALTMAKVESLFPVSLGQQLSKLVVPNAAGVALVCNDTRTRTKEYLTLITRTLDVENVAVLVLVPTDTIFQRQVAQILGNITIKDEDSRPAVGVMPWPTPYGEPFENLQQALVVKEKRKLTPLLKWTCPACSVYGTYFLVSINSHFIEFCEICGHRVSFGEAHTEDLTVDKKRWVVEVGGKEYPVYVPVLLNCDIPCPQCSMPLIPAFRAKSNKVLTFLLCKQCGFKIRLSFLLQELRIFPPKLLVASTRIIRWLTKDGSRFCNIYGKLRVCSNCGRVHPLSKPLGAINHNVLREVLRFIEDNYPKVLTNIESEYENVKEKYSRATLFKGLERKLLETREGIRKLAEDAERLDLANSKNLERDLQSKLKSLRGKLRSLELGDMGWKSEVEGEIKRNVDLRLSLEEEKKKLEKKLKFLRLRVAQARSKASKAKPLCPVLSLIYLIAKTLHLKWKPPHVLYKEACKELVLLESELKEIEVDVRTLSIRENTLRQEIKKNELNAEIDIIQQKIQKLEQVRNDFKYLRNAVRSLEAQAGISNAAESIRDMKRIIERVEDGVPGWRQRKEVVDRYLEVEARRAKLLSSWESDILSHALNVAKKEDPMDQELVLRDLSDCLAGCSFVKDWKITPSGRKFVEGDNSKLSVCKCGKQFKDVERTLSYVFLEDFHKMHAERGKDRIIRPNLQEAVKNLVRTGAKVIISSRT